MRRMEPTMSQTGYQALRTLLTLLLVGMVPAPLLLMLPHSNTAHLADPSLSSMVAKVFRLNP